MPGFRPAPVLPAGAAPGIFRYFFQALAAVFLLVSVYPACLSTAGAAPVKIEARVLADIQNPEFKLYARDKTCKHACRYRVVLIDNFEHRFSLVPEVTTTHGEMLVKLLKSGRNDIEATILNTTLARGLATLIRELSGGACADAVISSIPGSNYTNSQVRSLLPGKPDLNPDTRLADREALKALLRQIAFKGYPSVAWMEQADINLVKLKEDARKFVFIEALARFNVRVILPYGNPDTPHKGRAKSVNLLSLADNALVYSGLDQAGRRVPDFPYSPLSSGDEVSVYTILECPHPSDPFKAVLDINQDGFFDYTFTRKTRLSPGTPCRKRGILQGTSVIPPQKVKELLPPKKQPAKSG